MVQHIDIVFGLFVETTLRYSDIKSGYASAGHHSIAFLRDYSLNNLIAAAKQHESNNRQFA